ncbi:MAG: signal peptidase I [Planctomycetota bacterium]
MKPRKRYGSSDTASEGPVTYAKRVVGLPGDTVELKDGNLIINGAAVPRSEIGVMEEPGFPGGVHVCAETQGGKTVTIYDLGKNSWGRFGPVTVEPGRYFVLGDNRANSFDSRELGTIAREDIIGKVSHVYFSRDPEESAVRWSRFGLRIE